MPTYTQITDFSDKDGLPSGDTLKRIRGSEMDAELAAIATAISEAQDDVGTNTANGLALLDSNARLPQAQITIQPSFERLTLDGLNAPYLDQRPTLDAQRQLHVIADGNASDAERWRWLANSNANYVLQRATGSAGAEVYTQVWAIANATGVVDFNEIPTYDSNAIAYNGAEPQFDELNLEKAAGATAAVNFFNDLTGAGHALWRLKDTGASDAVRWRLRSASDSSIALQTATGSVGAESYTSILDHDYSTGVTDFKFEPTYLGNKIAYASGTPTFQQLTLENAGADPCIFSDVDTAALREIWKIRDASSSDAIRWQWQFDTDNALILQTAVGSAGSEVFLSSFEIENSTGVVNFTFAPTADGAPMQERDYKVTDVSADRTLQISDLGRFVALSGSTDRTLTIDPNATTDYPIGARVTLTARGLGAFNISPGSGVEMRSVLQVGNGDQKVSSRGSAFLVQVATDVWMLSGDIEL